MPDGERKPTTLNGFKANLEMHGADEARIRDDETIHVKSDVTWQTLLGRVEYEYTLIDEARTADGNMIMLEPVSF